MIAIRNRQPACEVKDHELYAHNWRFAELQKQLGEATCNVIYESVIEDFWQHFAPMVAKEFGYGQIYSEGRSNGWLMVSNPPDLSACDPCYGAEGKCADCEKWEDFERQIDILIIACRAEYYERLQEEIDNRAAEKIERTEMAARGVETI